VHTKFVKDLNEIQAEKLIENLKEFEEGVEKVRGMPVIRISKKRDNKKDDNYDKPLEMGVGGIGGVKTKDEKKMIIKTDFKEKMN
jgi:hypothetical protein